jgi:hypothetical protein
MATKKLPDLTFKLTEAEFLELSGGKADLLPGYTSLFAPEVEKKVLNGMMGRMLDFLKAEGNVKVHFRNVTAKKSDKGPEFAVVAFSDGEMTSET